MKKLIITFSLCLAGIAISNADILFTESFDYPDGALSDVSPDWSIHSGTGGPIMVSAGAIQIADTGFEDVNRALGTTISSGSVFASFEFSVTAGAVVGGGDYEYFAHFGPVDGLFTYVSRIDVAAALGGGDYTLGLGQSSTADVYWGSDLTFGVTYTAVTEYNRDTGFSTLWIDPVSMASTSIVTIGTAFEDMTRFMLRQSGSSANEIITLDNLVVGTAFTDVVVVPEPSTIAAIFGLFALGFVMYRRRK